VHDAEDEHFRSREVVEHDVRETFDGPIANAVVNRSATFWIGSQLLDGSVDAYQKVRPKRRLPVVVPFGGA
jgi:hypothetical protein